MLNRNKIKKIQMKHRKINLNKIIFFIKSKNKKKILKCTRTATFKTYTHKQNSLILMSIALAQNADISTKKK